LFELSGGHSGFYKRCAVQEVGLSYLADRHRLYETGSSQKVMAPADFLDRARGIPPGVNIGADADDGSVGFCRNQ
jgi:hypothetical protein